MEEWYESLKADGLIPEGAKVTVTGYSLGGHLASAFNILHGAEEINQVVTFNGAGVGLIDSEISLASLLDDFRSLRDDPDAVAATIDDPTLRNLYLSVSWTSFTTQEWRSSIGEADRNRDYLDDGNALNSAD